MNSPIPNDTAVDTTNSSATASPAEASATLGDAGTPPATGNAPVAAPTPHAPPQHNPANDTRRRLRELLSVPERDRSDEQWDEIIELEIQLAPGNRLPAGDSGFSGTPSNNKPSSGRNNNGGGQNKKHGKRGPGGGGGNGGQGGNNGGGNRRPRQNKPQGNPAG